MKGGGLLAAVVKCLWSGGGGAVSGRGGGSVEWSGGAVRGGGEGTVSYAMDGNCSRE